MAFDVSNKALIVKNELILGASNEKNLLDYFNLVYDKNKDKYFLLEAEELKEKQNWRDIKFAVLSVLKKNDIKYEFAFTTKDNLNYLSSREEIKGESNYGVSEGVKEFIDKMLSESMKDVADIHIQMDRALGATIYFKKDGNLKLYKKLGYNVCLGYIRALYDTDGKVKDNLFDAFKFQSAIIPWEIEGQKLQLRYQSLPTYGDGTKVVCRILKLGTVEDSLDKDNFVTLDKLGYSEFHINSILKGVRKPQGAVIISGVTGSGKSTTLKNLLMWLNKITNYKKVFYSVEDPTEYIIPGVAQIPVLRTKKSNESPFKEPINALMRAAPDVIMIGEIRDEVTADGLVKATESGHKVLTTTHASTALEAIKRLYGFKVSPNDISAPSFISCLVYQKLLPKLCPHCRIKLKDKLEDSNVSEELLNLKNRLKHVVDLGNDEIYIRNEKGCSHCDEGVKGREVCTETIIPDLTMLTFFRENKMIEAKEYWRMLSDRNLNSDNFEGKTILEHAIYKVKKGIFSPLDVEIELGDIDADHHELQDIISRQERQNQYLLNSKNEGYMFSGSVKSRKIEPENDGFNL